MVRRVCTHCVVYGTAFALLLNCSARAQGVTATTPDTALWETRVFVNDGCPTTQVTAPLLRF